MPGHTCICRTQSNTVGRCTELGCNPLMSKKRKSIPLPVSAASTSTVYSHSRSVAVSDTIHACPGTVTSTPQPYHTRLPRNHAQDLLSKMTWPEIVNTAHLCSYSDMRHVQMGQPRPDPDPLVLKGAVVSGTAILWILFGFFLM